MKKVICPNCKNRIEYQSSIPEECPYCFFTIDPMRTLEFEYSEQSGNKVSSSNIHGIKQNDKIILQGKEYSIVEIISVEGGETTICKVEDGNKNTHALKLYFEFGNYREEPSYETLKRISSIADPNILYLHDFGVGANKYQGKYCYEISDFAKGGDLFSVPDFKAKYTKEFLLKNIVPEILHGIRKLHELKIYHCDLRPRNIFFKDLNQTEIFIGGFGSAKAYDLESESEIHKTSLVLGTVYSSPEQARGIISEKNDYYSFGIILLQLLYPEQISNDENFQLIDKRKFERMVERQYNGKSIIDFNPHYKRLNSLIEGLTIINHVNRFGKSEVEKWLNDESANFQKAPVYCKTCFAILDYDSIPPWAWGSGFCLECNFKNNKA